MSMPDMALAAQARVDEEIAKLIRSACDLRTQRNSFSSISRLPTETLAAIFIYSARDYHYTRNGHPTKTAPSWVNVSYVCRHWRNVALNCPTLWSYLFLTSPRWTEELLARSKQALLKLHIDIYHGPTRTDDKGLSFVRQVMNHIGRVQEFHLNLSGPRMCFDDLFLSLPAPCLQNLKISVRYWEEPSQQFSTLHTPALRTLELSRCPVPWHSFNPSALTTLSLHEVPSHLQQNTVEFLATLSCMQDLRYLYLEDALASAAGFLSSPEFHSFQTINLPRLSRLLIAAPLSTLTAFVTCVNIPLKAEIRLDSDRDTEDDDLFLDDQPSLTLDDYASFFSVVAQRFSTSTLSGSTFRSLVIDLRDSTAVLTFSSSQRDFDSFDLVLQQDWGCNTPLKIRVRLSDTRSSLDCILGDVSSFVPLMDIQSVHVIKPPISPAIWRNALGHLQDLRYLKLSSGDLPNLTPVLSLTDRMLAPALEKLELRNISFQKRSKKDMNKRPVDVRALCDALATRKGSSGKLVITECIERIMRVRSVWEKRFNMVGRWKNGRFRVVEKHGVPFSEESEDTDT